MADDPIVVYGLGLGGVQLVKSPLEMSDNEVTSAQNAEPYRERGIAGIRKRAGLQKVVPTGTVPPGSGTDVPGGILPFEPPTTPPTGTTPQSPGGGAPTIDTLPTTTAAAWLNTKYNLIVASYEFLPCFIPRFVGEYLIAGGTESGQIVAWTNNKYLHELTRVPASGSANDTLVCGLWTGAGTTYAVVGVTDGKVYLYEPTDNVIIQLPTLGALVTGAVTYAGRLWVTSGLSVYSILPTIDTAWTTAYTSADAGIAQLVGLAKHNNKLYTGVKTSGTGTIRIYRLSSNGNGTATGTTAISAAQSTGPSYFFIGGSTSGVGLSGVYIGTNGASLSTGSETGSGVTDSRSVWMLTNTTWAEAFSINTVSGSSSSISFGPITTLPNFNGGTSSLGSFVFRYSTVSPASDTRWGVGWQSSGVWTTGTYDPGIFTVVLDGRANY